LITTEKPQLSLAASLLSRNAVLALIAVSLVLHDAEEYFTFPSFMAKASTRQLSGWLPSPALQHSVTNLHIALILATVLPGAVIAWAIISRSHGFLLAALFVEAVLLVNAFFHIFTAVVRASYVPGLVTAVLINLPFGIYVFRRGVRERWLRHRRAWQLIIAAFVVHVVWLGSGIITAFRAVSKS
jgi:hypothetical protein